MVKSRNIKWLVMDVDGTMTDGKIYMGASGETFKVFDVKDGYAIHEILPKYGIKSIIMTGRTSDIVLNRAKELEIDYVYQGIKDKTAKIKEIAAEFAIDVSQIAYIGDDLIDLEPMKLCGVSGCPADAVDEIRKISSFVSGKRGGDGAVREFIEWLIKDTERNEI